MEERKDQFKLSGNSVIGAVVAVAALVAIFFVAKFIFGLLYSYAWLLLIPTVIIDHKVITGYFNWMIGLLKKKGTLGFVVAIFLVLVYPFVSIFLFGKAMFKRKIKQAQEEVNQRQEAEFVNFEEIKEETPLQLREVEKQKNSKGDAYEDLFEE